MRAFGFGLLLTILVPTWAGATDVTFSGTLSGVCTLALASPGTLALSVDGTKFGSEETGGVAASLTILSVGSNTVTFGAPTRTSAPGGYNATGETIEVSYVGLGGLSLINHAYGTTSSNFGVSSLPLTTVLVNSRINNANGFAPGTYSTRTVVTCS